MKNKIVLSIKCNPKAMKENKFQFMKSIFVWVNHALRHFVLTKRQIEVGKRDLGH